MKKTYTREQILEAISYWENQLKTGNYRMVNEASQNNIARRFGEIARRFGDSPARIVLRGTFMRNGNAAYDCLYRTDEYYALNVIKIDGVNLICADGSDGDVPDAMTWIEIAEVRHDVTTLVFGEGKIDLTAPDVVVQADADGNAIVQFQGEWWVTDSIFFRDWSERLFNADQWSDSRDYDEMYDDISDKLLALAKRRGEKDNIYRLAAFAGELEGYDDFDEQDDENVRSLVIMLTTGLDRAHQPLVSDPSKDHVAAEGILELVRQCPAKDVQEFEQWSDALGR